MVFQLVYKTDTRIRIGIAAINEGMYIEVFYAQFSSSISQAFNMPDVRMNTAIGYQSDQMHILVMLYGIFKCLFQHRVAYKFMVVNSFMDTAKFLINNATGPQIHMPNF